MYKIHTRHVECNGIRNRTIEKIVRCGAGIDGAVIARCWCKLKTCLTDHTSPAAWLLTIVKTNNVVTVAFPRHLGWWIT